MRLCDLDVVRDQHNIASDDPRQVLGPYAEPGHAGHKAYWHAAKSVLAARRLRGLDQAGIAGNAESQASAQVAADVFLALPEAEREAMANVIAETPGITWLGRPDGPDEYAVSHPGYAHTLAATLTKHGHLDNLDGHIHGGRGGPAEPFEADFARRRQAANPRPAVLRTPEPGQVQRSQSTLHPAPPDARTAAPVPTLTT
jgi:hypothetical protein